MSATFNCGHPRTPENSLPRNKRPPICRICRRAWDRAYQAGLIAGNGRPQRRIPEDFAQVVASHLMIKDVVAHYSTSVAVVNRWIRESGAKLKPRRKDAPADFAANCAAMTKAGLSRHYKVHANTVERWLSDSGLTALAREASPHRRHVPEGFAELAPTMHKSALERHFHASTEIVTRWLAETGTVAAKAPPSKLPPRTFRVSNHRTSASYNIQQAARPSSIFDDAADVLRRWTPVYRCNAKGKADQDGEFWRVGWSVITPDELLERAERKRSAA